MKFRLLISTSFAVLCIVLLMDEGREVHFKAPVKSKVKLFDLNTDLRTQKNDSKYLRIFKQLQRQHLLQSNVKFGENIEVLFCRPLRQIFSNRSELHLEKVSDDLVEFFLETFNESLPSEENSSSTARKRLANKLNAFESAVLEPLKARRYYIVRNRFCLTLQRFYLAKPIIDEMFHNPQYFFFAKDSFNFVQSRPGLDLELVLMSNEENPAFNCSGNFTKFECLNECLKGRRLARYFYEGRENGVVYLEPGDADELKRHERGCFERCERAFCVLSFLSGERGNGTLTTSRMRSTLSIPPFNYWIQMSGLLLSLFGTCIYRLAAQPVKLLSNENQKVMLIFRVLIALLCLAAFLYLAVKLFGDFLVARKDRTPSFAVRYLAGPENLNLAICVPVIHALNRYNDELLHRSGLDLGHLTYLLAQHSLKELNFTELEAETDDAFDETVDEIYLEVLGKRSEVTWQLLEDRVLFWMDEKRLFSRCFQVFVNLSIARYEAFLSTPKLAISFKHHLYSLYLVPDGQRFHSASYRHEKLFKYTKRVYTFPAGSCRDYRKHFGEGRSKCDTFYNCVDRCAQETSISENRNVSVIGLIDRDWFSEHQWSDLFPDFSGEALRTYKEAKNKCDESLPGDCTHAFYDRVNEPESDFNLNKLVENVKLYSEIASSGIEESYGTKLLFDLLNVQGI